MIFWHCFMILLLRNKTGLIHVKKRVFLVKNIYIFSILFARVYKKQ